MCAMYILSIIESRPNNDDHASADNAAPHHEEAHGHDNLEWACGACSFLNHIDLLQCEICETAKPN